MKKTLLAWGVLCLLAGGSAFAADPPQRQTKRPNILLIVADDLGYSDIGAFGGEISTPNLDKLAKEGLRMTNFYASMFCSPTRAMLMSGADNHRAGFGSMAELLTPEQRSKAGYEGYLNERVVAFPELLHDAGYHTYMAGKWHLGVKEEHSPAKRGFEQSYAMVQGGASHFDQTGIITDDPAKTPKALYREDGKSVDIPKEAFYSSEYFSDKIISYIDSNKGDSKPFFAYLAFTAPHWPLQAPDEYIKKYEGKYDVGYDAIRAGRLSRMKALGIVPKDIQPYTGNSVWPTWQKLSPLQKAVESKRMAVYAAMVDAMDAQIGRVVDYLKKTGEYDNTLIFFMSDNGADGNSVLDEQADREWVRLHANNSVENTGRKGSFVEYGPGWAQVSSTPMHLYKAFAYEGGIAVPSIVVMPGHLLPGKTSAVPAHVTDVAPTMLELAGLKKPGTEYKGRTIFPMTGESMLSFLSGEIKTVHPDGFEKGWELNGRKAMRKGDWKIAYANKPWGSGKWELYNIAKDRSELHDVAKKYPAMVKELIAEYEKYKQDNGVVEFPGLAERKGYSNGTYYYQDILDQTK